MKTKATRTLKKEEKEQQQPADKNKNKNKNKNKKKLHRFWTICRLFVCTWSKCVFVFAAGASITWNPAKWNQRPVGKYAAFIPV